MEFAGVNRRFLSHSLPPPAPRNWLLNRRVLAYGQKVAMNVLEYIQFYKSVNLFV